MINTKNDVEVLPGADDSYSEIAFNPVNDLIAATSWDNYVFYFLIVVAYMGCNVKWFYCVKNFSKA